jgi:LuxR family maltose regulon positive regulatory protein
MPNAVRDSRVMVPQLPPRHIPRNRLLAELDIAADLPLTLLSAGPGAGKTVLLTDWVRRSAARIAWLTPTPADAEPRRFWRLLEGALREAHGGERGPPITPTRGAGVDLVQTLFSRMPDPGRLVVIVDDAHVLTHSDVLEGLDSLVRGWQPGLRLILASRSDPVLPLHRYRWPGRCTSCARATWR